jgi:hypothetical protein
MYFRVSVLVLGAALLFSACSSGPKYATNKSDDSYDLQAMSLAEEDLPAGYLQQDARIFNNQDWAAVMPPGDDPQGIQNKLDAEGRLSGAAAIFSWDNPSEHLGRPYQIATQSTLYSTAAEASKALQQYFCDVLIDPTSPQITDFKVTGIGDEAVGFMSTTTVQGFGDSIDTAVCFRTGRILHAVIQSGLDGTPDVALDVRLAQKMLSRVDDALAGRTAPSTPTPQGGPGALPTSGASPVPSASPVQSATPASSPVGTAVATSTPKAGN